MQNESVAMQMAEMFRRGYSSRGIAKRFGWSAATVRRWLRKLGVDMGGPGRKLEITQEYVDLAARMRSEGASWEVVSKKLGFSVRQLQKRLYGK